MKNDPKLGNLVTGHGMIGIIFRIDDDGWAHISWSSDGGRTGRTYYRDVKTIATMEKN
jgi:hypothetical protein